MNLVGILLRIGLCSGSILGYIPQFYNIIKYESVEGISEMSLVILNIGFMCLTMNCIIFSWEYFCSTFTCFSNLFPLFQIALSWLLVLVYYIIFIIYKFRKNKKYEKRILSGLHYAITYFIFGIFVVALALGEKIGSHNKNFFTVFANVLGYSSALSNGLVYIPQIYKLHRIKSPGNISFLMYIIQTPGNLITIFFQAVIFSMPISTWMTYVIVFIEQSIVLLMMTYYYYKRYELIEDVDF